MEPMLKWLQKKTENKQMYIMRDNDKYCKKKQTNKQKQDRGMVGTVFDMMVKESLWLGDIWRENLMWGGII